MNEIRYIINTDISDLKEVIDKIQSGEMTIEEARNIKIDFQILENGKEILYKFFIA